MTTTMTLQDYLKKFSSINNAFIDDFFKMYDENTDDTDFVTDFDAVVKWLKIRKDSLKRTLIESYRENIDYKLKLNKNSNVGRPIETIYLTPDCFKRICMLSKSNKGEEVRTYYIQLEKHIDKYKDNIINDLRNRVKVLERNMKDIDIPKNEGVIYVLKTDDTIGISDIYKIGATKDFKSRIATHHTSHVDNVEISYIYKTNDIIGVENCVKGFLRDRQYRKRKEFYQADLQMIKDIITKCGDAALIKKAKPTNKKGDNNNYYIYLQKN